MAAMEPHTDSPAVGYGGGFQDFALVGAPAGIPGKLKNWEAGAVIRGDGASGGHYRNGLLPIN